MRPEDELSAQIVGAAIPYDSEPERLPIWFQTIDAAPGATALMGNTMNRGANTIIKGAKAKRGINASRGVRSPFSWAREHLNITSRYSTQNYFFPNSKRYTPFGAAQFGNRAIGWLGKETGVGGRVGGVLGVRSRAASLAETGGIFSQGMFGKLAAGGRMASMSDAAFARQAGAPNFIGRAIAEGAIDRKGFVTAADRLGAKNASSFATYATAGRAGGFLGAARHGLTSLGASATSEYLGTIAHSNTAARAGANRAIQWADELADYGLKQGYGVRQALGSGFRAARAGSVGVAAKGAGLAGARLAAGLSNPIVGAAMAAWTVYDLTRMAATAASGIPRFVGDAIKSYQGTTRQRFMDPGFKDTEASMTARSRGVQAISNSRLNARSILGNEASAMARHFG